MKEDVFPGMKKSSKVAIVMHSTPDPDAMGAALGTQWLCKKAYNCTTVDIFHHGEISHPANLAMKNLLNLSFKPINELEGKKYDIVIIVDGTESNSMIPEGIKVNFIIDHHKVKIKEEDYDKVYIEHVGACSTIVWKLIGSAELHLDKNDEDENIATAMLYGIITDTGTLLKEDTHSDDFKAYAALSSIADVGNIKKIQNYPLPSYIFDTISAATNEENSLESNGVYASFLGVLPAVRRDALPFLSEMFARRPGISTTIMVAVVGDDMLEASVRSYDVSIDINDLCAKLFGKEFSGGKKGEGGAKVPLGFLSIDDESKEQTLEVIRTKVMGKIKKEFAK